MARRDGFWWSQTATFRLECLAEQIAGEGQENPLGYYTYLKTLADGSNAPAMVAVHLLAVEKVSDKFPEYKERTMERMSPIEAATRVEEPELKGLLAVLATRSAA